MFVHDAPDGPSELRLIAVAVCSGSPLVSGNKVTNGPECVCCPDSGTAHVTDDLISRGNT
jgi:hypothetical protein